MKENIAGITGLAHIGWSTADRDGAMALLCDAFGVEHGRSQFSDQPYLSEVTGFPGCAIKIGFIQIDGDATPLEILEYVRPEGGRMRMALGEPGAGHLCFETDSIGAFAKKLEANGLSLCAEPRVMGFGPWQGQRGAFFAMPDGLVVELLEDGSGTAEGRLKKLHHVGYSVSDAAGISGTFCDIMGRECAGRWDAADGYFGAEAGITAAEYVKLSEGGFLLELLQCEKGGMPQVATNMPGNVHICFMVDDLMSGYQALEAQGLRFVHTPGRVTAGVNEGAMAGYLREPHEVRCEFFQGKPTRVAG